MHKLCLRRSCTACCSTSIQLTKKLYPSIHKIPLTEYPSCLKLFSCCNYSGLWMQKLYNEFLELRVYIKSTRNDMTK